MVVVVVSTVVGALSRTVMVPTMVSGSVSVTVWFCVLREKVVMVRVDVFITISVAVTFSSTVEVDFSVVIPVVRVVT